MGNLSKGSRWTKTGGIPLGIPCGPHIITPDVSLKFRVPTVGVSHWAAVVLLHFYRAMHFSAKRGIAIACRLSVRLSVCLSVCNVGEL